MRRVPLGLAVWALILSAGCSRPPAVVESTEPSPSPRASADDGTAVRAELARRDAELAATRAELQDLRRRFDDRAPPAAGPAPVVLPDGLTLIARKRLHEGPVTSVAFAPDGKSVASTDALGRVLVSTATDLAPVLTLEAVTGVGVQNCTHSVCFAPDGRHLAAGSEDQTVWIWRADDGKLVKRIRGHRDAVDYVAFLPDGRGGLSFDRQGAGLAWSVQGERRELIPDRRLRKAALAPDGELLVWSDGGQTHCGPPGKEAPATTLGGFADALAVSPDGELVAKGSSASVVEIWDPRTGLRRWAGPPQPGRVQALAFRADGAVLVSLAGGALSVWDTRTGDETYRFRIRTEEGANRLALGPDGKTLAIGNRRGTVTVVRLPE